MFGNQRFEPVNYISVIIVATCMGAYLWSSYGSVGFTYVAKPHETPCCRPQRPQRTQADPTPATLLNVTHRNHESETRAARISQPYKWRFTRDMRFCKMCCIDRCCFSFVSRLTQDPGLVRLNRTEIRSNHKIRIASVAKSNVNG